MELSVIIPAYNEECCIRNTTTNIIKILKQECIPHEILIINDNSTDNTEKILAELSKQFCTVRCINNSPPKGIGLAIKKGLECFHGDVVTIVMADGSDFPEDIVSYYRQLENGYDCVFGSRFIQGGKRIDYPSYKLIMNRLVNWLIKIIFNIEYNDITNAFKGYRKEVIHGIKPILSSHFNITVEMPLKAIVRNYCYTIIPISWKNRTQGKSKLKLKEMGSRYFFSILYVFLEKLLRRSNRS